MDGITAHAQNDAAFRSDATKLSNAWRAQLAASNKTVIPGLAGTSNASQLAAVSQLSAHLKAGTSPDTEILSKTGNMADSSALGAHAASVSAAAINGNSPNTFPVRGSVGSGRTFWQNMTLSVGYHYCNVAGCEAPTDVYSSRLRIDPGAQFSKFSSTNLYSPYAGNFANKHFELWGINKGVVGPSDNTSNLAASEVDYNFNQPISNGTVLTLAVTLWVYVTPYAEYVADGAKTNDATCNKTNNTCRY